MTKKSKEYLLKAYDIYSKTGKTSIPIEDITWADNVNDYFMELQTLGYIDFHFTAAPYITLLQEGIDYSKNLI